MIRPIKQKDKTNFIDFCSKRDKYSDFYITRDNKRMFLNNRKVAERVFNNCLKHGDKCYLYYDEGILRGVAIIDGYSDHSKRFLKVYSFSKYATDKLMKYVNWHHKRDLYIKVKKYNPVFTKSIRRKYNKNKYNYNFRLVNQTNKEILLKKEPYNKGNSNGSR